MRIKIVGPLLLVLSMLVGVARAAPDAGLEISRHVIAGGGGRAEGGTYVLHGTFAQSVATKASQWPYELCSGYWCGVSSGYEIYLPLVMR